MYDPRFPYPGPDDIRAALKRLHTLAPDSAGDLLRLELLSCDPAAGKYRFLGKTAQWMKNVNGTLHGGVGATLLDQSMGIVCFCLRPESAPSPTIELHLDYLRPIFPEDQVQVLVRIISVTRSLVRLTAEVSRDDDPEKLCLSGGATYFCRPAGN